MPNVAAKVWQQLGLDAATAGQDWEALAWGGFPAGTKIQRGEALFPRIDWEKQLAEENEGAAEESAAAEEPMAEIAPIKPEISIEDFERIDLRVCQVVACEKVKKADKLLQLTVKLGNEERTVVSGIAQYYQPDELVGRQVVLVANLKPAKLRGIESRGMILAASDGDKLQVLQVPAEILPGSIVR